MSSGGGGGGRGRGGGGRGRGRRGGRSSRSASASASSSSQDQKMANLSASLGMSMEEVTAIMSCGGTGTGPTTRKSAAAGGASSNTSAAATASSTWMDFMEEAGGAAETSNTKDDSATTPTPITTTTTTTTTTTAAASNTASSTTATTTSLSSTGAPSVSLTVLPRAILDGAAENGKEGGSTPMPMQAAAAQVIPGDLAQMGTLDASLVGRKDVASSDSSAHHLRQATLLTRFLGAPSQAKVALVAASPSSCHALCLLTDGSAYGWGRNETAQLGLGHVSPVVGVPTRIPLGGERFVGAATGKSHSLLVSTEGNVWGSGANKVGQCGVGVTSATHNITSFRQCVVVAATARRKRGSRNKKGKAPKEAEESARKRLRKSKRQQQQEEEEEEEDEGEENDGDDEKDEENDDDDEEGAKIVQVACGEFFSVALDSRGRLYTCGSAEFGQLGNGETGESIVTANKVTFGVSSKFGHRSLFVAGEDFGGEGSLFTDERGQKRRILEDSSRVRLSSIACGKNHTVAVEQYAGKIHDEGAPPRVFTWGCGAYGCLGHGAQMDEYLPRVVSFATPALLGGGNYPRRASAGAQCSVVLTASRGHAYYWGRHRPVGEATMKPQLLDFLANNGHVVTCAAGGNQSLVLSTTNGNTVVWGMGPYGELGLGEKKSTAKPQFVVGLDQCLVTQVACGYGTTMVVLRRQDDEDEAALKKVPTLETAQMQDWLESLGTAQLDDDDEDHEEAAEPETTTSKKRKQPSKHKAKK